ncbi:hypothetical protein [Saccharothrix sp.]|uniref:hypothetical protein n=1 Tax=Saccharothrix sp. TaxID=1873460 RepID=UPI002811DA1B|nr:hypothetical protein [Saccharothrix sp.]
MLVAVLTACEGTDNADRAHKFTNCMRDNGVDLAPPTMRSDGTAVIGAFPADTDAEVLNTARLTCQDLHPATYTNREDPRAAEDGRRIAECLRTNGVPGEIDLTVPEQFHPFDPARRKAKILCSDHHTYFKPGED